MDRYISPGAPSTHIDKPAFQSARTLFGIRSRWCEHTTCEREREMFYLTTHSTHFIYGYMASDIWLRTILIVRKETRCRHIGYSYRLTARVLLYAPSHRQDNTYHGLSYSSRGALAETRNSSMGSPHEGSIWRPTAPWANALPLSYVPLLLHVMHEPAIVQTAGYACKSIRTTAASVSHGEHEFAPFKEIVSSSTRLVTCFWMSMSDVEVSAMQLTCYR